MANEFVRTYAEDIRNEWRDVLGPDAPETDYERYRFVVSDLLGIQWRNVRDEASEAFADAMGEEPVDDGEWADWLIRGVCRELGVRTY